MRRFRGEIVREHEVEGFILTETRYAPGLELARHAHDLPYFCFVLRGGFTDVSENRTRDCSPSTVFLRPAGERHADRFGSTGGHCLNLEIAAGRAERLCERSTVLEDRAEFHGGAVAALTSKLVHEFQSMDDLSGLVIEGLALEILGEAARLETRRESRPPRWLERSRDLVSATFRERPSLAAVAEAAGVHPAHLAREFRRHYRCSVGEYVRRLSIDFARAELSATDRPIAEIAVAAGYYDQSHFSRTFKRLTRMTPAEFRSLHRRR